MKLKKKKLNETGIKRGKIFEGRKKTRKKWGRVL